MLSFRGSLMCNFTAVSRSLCPMIVVMISWIDGRCGELAGRGGGIGGSDMHAPRKGTQIIL
jgi:hypothetical protein